MDTIPSTKLSAIGYLHFAYIGIEIVMSRQLVRALMLTTNSDSSAVQSCRAKAKKWFLDAVDFVQQLQAKHLTAFWYYTSANACVMIYDIGRLLATCAPDLADQTECLQKLREFRWALKVNSEAGASFCRRGLSLINLLCKMGSQGCTEDTNRTSSPGSALMSNTGTTPEQTHQQRHAQPYPTAQYQTWIAGVDPYAGTWAGQAIMPQASGYAPEMGMFGTPQMAPMHGHSQDHAHGYMDCSNAWMSSMHQQ